METETDFCGVYTSIKDANNKVIDLWLESDLYSCSYGDDTEQNVEADGRMSWDARDGEGDGTKVWIEKQVLVEETNDEARDWSSIRPDGPYIDEDDYSAEESAHEYN